MNLVLFKNDAKSFSLQLLSQFFFRKGNKETRDYLFDGYKAGVHTESEREVSGGSI